MTNWQWAVVAIVCVIAGIVVSRLLIPTRKRNRAPTARKTADEIAVSELLPWLALQPC